jgi:hypothetical protein
MENKKKNHNNVNFSSD